MEGMGTVMRGNSSAQFGPASFTDILVPPAIALTLMTLGMVLLSRALQPRWWKHHYCKIRNKHKDIGNGRISPSNGVENVFTVKPANTRESELFSSEDEEILLHFQMFQNNPIAMFKLALPAFISVGFCPVTIILQPMMVDFFYPESYGGRKNTNDSLAVFLLPAGLVYAMAFGFALQDSLAKFDVTKATAARHVTLLRHCRHLIGCSRALSTQQKLDMLRSLSRCTTVWMKHQMNPKQDKQNDESIWRMIEIIRSCSRGNDSEAKLLDEMFDKLLELESITEEGYMGADANINTLQWAFMELLGFIAFFGILLIVAESYRLELTMCILTVFSISAFVYILGDLDYAYHGTFRVCLHVFVDMLYSLQEQYEAVRMSAGKLTDCQTQELS